MNSKQKIILNSAIAGGLVFLGSASTEITKNGFNNPQELCTGLILGLITGGVVFLTKLQALTSEPLTKNKKGEVRLFDFI